MSEKEYTINIDGLKISGTVDQILKLSEIVDHAKSYCRNVQFTLTTARNSGRLSKHGLNEDDYNQLIGNLKEKERQLVGTYNQLIYAVQDDEYYKQYNCEYHQIAAKIVTNILKELEAEERELNSSLSK